jgi:hypothetical protein
MNEILPFDYQFYAKHQIFDQNQASVLCWVYVTEIDAMQNYQSREQLALTRLLKDMC